MKILVFGGDRRQLSAANYLENEGHTVVLGGMEDCGDTDDYDTVVFPLPLSRDGVNINCPLSSKEYSLCKFISTVPRGITVFAGLVSSFQRSLFEERKIRCIDYYDNEAFQIKNAVPTAEGAIILYAEKSRKSVWRSTFAVIGFGKVGKALASRLQALGGEVTVVARSERDRALAAIMGMNAVTLDKFVPSQNCIFNTVPVNVFDCEFAERIKNTILIELASKPYCMASDVSSILGENYVPAPSLPGRFFPETAGFIIGETVSKYLETIN